MVYIRKTLYLARFSSTIRCVGVFVFQCSSFLFFGSVFCESVANTMLCVLCLSSILASFSKFLSGKLQKREVFAWSTCGKPSNKYPEMTTKTIATSATSESPHHHIAEEGQQNKKKTQVAFAWTSSPPPSPHCTAPPHSRRRSTKQKENTSRIRMDVIAPPPPHPSPPLHRTTT